MRHLAYPRLASLTLSIVCASLVTQEVKNLPAMQEPKEIHFQSLGQEDPLDEGMAAHSSILAWRIPWTEQPGRLQSIGSQSWTRLKQLSTGNGRFSRFSFRKWNWSEFYLIKIPNMTFTLVMLINAFKSRGEAELIWFLPTPGLCSWGFFLEVIRSLD